MISSRVYKRYYPDDSKNGTLFFYQWLRSYIQPDYVALNFGAGHSVDDKTRSLKGEVRKVIGVDIDREVVNNANVDETIVIKDDILPFPDNTFDLIWSDYVLEHIEKPGIFIKEIYRVLKPGASFFFRTPNKYHYVSLIARLTPDWFHKLIANKARGLSSEAHEPYPTFHRLNSRRDLTTYSRLTGFQKMELKFVEAEPSYLMFHPIPFLLGVFYERTVNSSDRLSGVRSNIFGRFEK